MLMKTNQGGGDLVVVSDPRLADPPSLGLRFSSRNIFLLISKRGYCREPLSHGKPWFGFQRPPPQLHAQTEVSQLRVKETQMLKILSLISEVILNWHKRKSFLHVSCNGPEEQIKTTWWKHVGAAHPRVQETFPHGRPHTEMPLWRIFS